MNAEIFAGERMYFEALRPYGSDYITLVANIGELDINVTISNEIIVLRQHIVVVKQRKLLMMTTRLCF